ncbi:capping protein-inhibiting regulator of actin dynamics [Mixophyes fleayi]|uniref:capping protein-inhibiting regulator of actin dynamics n=1 Tax=Mixophyes fleayi TaxID=3061075 RepID=UPI003F4DF503
MCNIYISVIRRNSMADEREARQAAQEELLSAKVSEKKRTGKFQPLRKFFGKKKKKSSSLGFQEGKLKPSGSIGSVCSNPASALSSDEEACDDLRFLTNSMGTRAFSHDSIFIPDGQAEDEQGIQTISQEYIVGKVKSLQQQLGKNIRFGQPPPANVPVKRVQDMDVSTEEMERTHNSPMEILGELDMGSDGNRNTGSPSSHRPLNVSGPEHKADEKVSPVKSSRPKRPSGTIDSINLDAVPRSIARLDNSAAKYKLSVKPKNQRVSKKHRALSQEYSSVEDSEHNTALKLQRSSDKAMFHSMEMSTQDVIIFDHSEHKAFELHISKHVQTSTPKGEYEGNGNVEEKHQETIIFKYEDESRQLDEKNKLEADKRKEEEEQKIKEVIKKIDLERLQQKQKEIELKEPCRRKEERKLQAGQILKEQTRQDEQRHREHEDQKALQLVEQRKNLEQQKVLQIAEQQRSLQAADEQKRSELELQKALQVTEEQKRHELEKQKALQIAEEQKRHELVEQKALQIAEEQKRHELVEQKALQIAEERKRHELVEQKALQKAEERKRHELVEQKALQKALQKAEERKRHELVEQKALQKALQKVEERKRHELVEQKALQIVEEQKQRTPKGQDSYELGENRSLHHKEEKFRNEDLIRTEGQKQPELQMQELLQKIEQMNERVHKDALPAQLSSLDPGGGLIDLPEKQTMKEEVKEDEGELKQRQQRQDEFQKQERINEETRWQELDQRQRPFTFTVTSREKQIIFEKVNLSPVTPLKEPATCIETQDAKESKVNISSHAFPSSQSIPHTAILVTGAQLCGTDVNLNQIKDTACKSLLGLTEERKIDITEIKTEREKDNTKHISIKTKYTSESLDSESVLAEFASIRSKILSKSENTSIPENIRRGPRVSSDDWTAKGRGESHSKIRKTVSANAKFSITPAWQKFPETIKYAEISSDAQIKQSSKENIATVLSDNATQGKPTERIVSVQEIVTSKIKKQVTIEDNTEGWIFSKDLPSFLVPSPPQSPRRGQLDRQSTLETQMSNGIRKSEKLLQNTEDKISPFGIKLRRTNFSLRFTSDTQLDQKRKKRYSAGDSFDGIPASFIAAEETEVRTISRKELSVSPHKMTKDSVVKVLLDTSNNPSDNVHFTVVSPVIPAISCHVSSPNKDRLVPKSPIIQKPSLAPKPPSPTPPSSPLSKPSRTNMTDLHGQKLDIGEQDKETFEVDIKTNAVLSTLNQSGNESLEHDIKDKTCFSSIALREKAEKRPENIGIDRPILQSRHSFDGTRLMEKVESAQPLWITMALQKQKEFREKHATREERQQAREAKKEDKLAKKNASSIQTGEYRSRSGSLQKPVPQEEKKCDSPVTRLQRREQLQKSNTLPTSVTVEITETVPVTLAKDLPKRFSTPDAIPVSSEPAWLALAKRKSKAWSDCPQFIK